MIVTGKSMTWLRMVFSLRDTTLSQIKGRVFLATLCALGVTWLHLQRGLFEGVAHGFTGSLSPLPFSFMGLALSIFLGFRNSTSYDRFWEGRKLWGQLVNTTRSLSRAVLCYLVPQPAAAQAVVQQWQNDMHRYLTAYVHALRLHLRDEGSEPLKPYLSEAELLILTQQRNRPNYLNLRLSQLLAEAQQKGWIQPYHLAIFEARLHELSNLQGGCERIKSTPIPFLYMVLMHRLVAIYCFALPFGIVDTTEVYTPFVVMIVSYAFMGLDAIGDSIENPFETEPHDLPLTQISNQIAHALCEQQGLCLQEPTEDVDMPGDNYQVVL